ncbi:CaiB/BaiF CoA transferase family protein [Sagittula sp.]|uniref:CaiB/BaiF CoA transferase family protein n=1 Tax=Sagittula sp. TaxID=2038081 RepID=UPI00405861F8
MLTGLRILEFEALGPTPFAAMHLADLGAEVTVIHRATPDNPSKQPNNLLDRGKRSIVLDLKTPEDIVVAKALIARSDALIEGMRPGVMERLGLGPEVAHALNPGLVYGRMTGWGQDGPRARQAGHDLNYAGLSGTLFYGGLPGDVPGVPPTLLGDIGGGALYLTVGILSGVLNARRTGKGCVVDAAIVDGTSHMLSLLLSMGPMFSREARGASLLDGPHWSRCYVCADGGHVAVQCLEPKFYAEFLEIMGLGGDPAFAEQFDPVQWPVQTARLAGLFAARPRDEWVSLFDGSDACVAPVLSPAEAQQDPHIAARGIWQDGVPAPAPRFDGVVLGTGDIAPRGAKGAEIRETLRQEGLI